MAAPVGLGMAALFHLARAAEPALNELRSDRRDHAPALSKIAENSLKATAYGLGAGVCAMQWPAAVVVGCLLGAALQTQNPYRPGAVIDGDTEINLLGVMGINKRKKKKKKPAAQPTSQQVTQCAMPPRALN